MRREIIRSSQSVTLRLVSDTQGERERALSPFGPVRAGLTTMQRTQEAQLEELLSILEKKVEILQSRYLEAFATSSIDTTTQPVVPLNIAIDEDGTNER